jgi:F-type H+-transporting ATPase subunit b
MPIDWFTVVAQVINFLILVWLLKRFLYKPILDAIDTREQRIADELAGAGAAKADALKERGDFEDKNQAFAHQRAALLKKASDEAESERNRLFEAARKDADTLRAQRRDELEAEQESLSAEIARRIQKEVFAIARKTLQDLASVSLEERMSNVFIQQLRSLDGEMKKELAASVQTAKQPSRVRSAFELSTKQQSKIQTALNETLAVDIQIRFETVPDLISGIEISVSGKKMAWSVNDYLDMFEKETAK